MLNKFKGIFPALLTPFGDDKKINVEALEKLIKLNLEKGVQGFYIGGSTAEAFLMEVEERKELFKIVKGIVNDRCLLIAHVGCISTEQAVELAKVAEEYKYDAISAISPFYYKFNFSKIKKYYYDIVSAVDLPMIIYNFPAFSGVELTLDNISEFLKDERFIGVKFTSNDFFLLERIKTAYPEKLVYNGFDEMFLAGLAMGADGGIGSTYNFMAEKFVEMTKCFKEGKMKEALQIQRDANAIIQVLIRVGVIEGEKEILNIMGIDFGKCRPPFADLSLKDIQMLNQVLRLS